MNTKVPQAGRAAPESLAGTVERVTFQSGETGFSVLKVKVKDFRDLVAVVGIMPSATAGEWIEAAGRWENDREHGRQFKVETINTTRPDTLEWNQPFGKEASEYLADLVKDKTVSIIVRSRDGYGRDIADLYVDDLWVIGRLVENGYAWNYTTYSDSEELAALEKQAREAKRGLWADPSPISPWDYRKQKSGRTDLSSVITDKSALYATKFGKKYHRSDCKFLTKTAVPVTLEEAKRRGLEPCASCRP